MKLQETKSTFICMYCNKQFFQYKYRNPKYCSLNCSHSAGHSHKGKNHSEETRKLLSIKAKSNESIKNTQFKKGHKLWDNQNCKKNWFKKGIIPQNYKGGTRTYWEKIRDSAEYRKWRMSVFRRDNWTCVWCLSKGVEIQADHIKPKSLFPELMFDIDNGRTLCVPCHMKTDTWGGRCK